MQQKRWHGRFVLCHLVKLILTFQGFPVLSKTRFLWATRDILYEIWREMLKQCSYLFILGNQYARNQGLLQASHMGAYLDWLHLWHWLHPCSSFIYYCVFSLSFANVPWQRAPAFPIAYTLWNLDVWWYWKPSTSFTSSWRIPLHFHKIQGFFSLHIHFHLNVFHANFRA